MDLDIQRYGPLLVGCMALVGALGGSLGGAALTAWMTSFRETVRHRREMAGKHHDHLRATYAEWMAMVNKIPIDTEDGHQPTNHDDLHRATANLVLATSDEMEQEVASFIRSIVQWSGVFLLVYPNGFRGIADVRELRLDKERMAMWERSTELRQQWEDKRRELFKKIKNEVRQAKKESME
jgi:hypothetical protein